MFRDLACSLQNRRVQGVGIRRNAKPHPHFPEAMERAQRKEVPVVSIVVPFLGLPYRILILDLVKPKP